MVIYLSSKVTRLYLPTPTWYSLIPDWCTVFLYSSTSVNDSQLTNISDDDDYKTIKTQRRVLSNMVTWIISEQHGVCIFK